VSSLPRRALRPARRAGRRLAADVRARRRRRALLAAGPAEPGRVAVYYGVARLPARDAPVHGGAVKFQELHDVLPNTASFNVLYLGSSTVPTDADELVAVARRRGAAFVWNQDGVAYPAWHGPGWERTNEPIGRALHAADHVFFQSAFCKLSADRFLGERHDSWEILHNPVDTRRFTPVPRPERPPTLLLGGNQYQRYRFETALQTLALLPPEWRLVVSGAISWSPDRALAHREAARLLEEARLGDRVELVGTYTQAEAPDLLRRADVLLHPKVSDPCPTIVLEAMASGLPVVYSATGGTPELVGADAGVGVPGELDWEADRPPAPERLAAGVEEVVARLAVYAEAARACAERFDLRPWIERHREVFEGLVR
jgi:glycosyltransferase involved in cell wall biosynthesis